MVRRSTLILLVVFVILVGFAWILQHNQTNKQEAVATMTPTTTTAYLYNLNGRQVDDINIAASSGNQVDFFLDSTSGNWSIRDLPIEQADSLQIESKTAQLMALQAVETLVEPPPLDSIGLETPAYIITMTTADGGQLITNIGSVTAIGSGYYVKVGQDKVVIVDKVVMDDILSLLTNPPLLPTATPDVVSTEPVSPTESIIIGTPTP
jgi:hypothetical protein